LIKADRDDFINLGFCEGTNNAIKIIIIIAISFVALIGFALIRGGQYLHKEKFFKTGLREGLHNTTIDEYPVHKEGKRLLIIGQILIAVDILSAIFIYYFW
jgi:flagellar basal body-associated protein FliL